MTGNQEWGRKEPVVSTSEYQAVTPMTGVGMDDGYGIRSVGAGEADAIRYNNGTQSARYEGQRGGQPEGMGLPQGGNAMRPTVKRKEISRKSVLGHGS